MNSNNRIYGDSYSPYTFPDHGYDTSVVLTWNHPLSHYKSPADYLLDPLDTRIAQVWNSRESSIHYSSEKKAFEPVVPFNTYTTKNSSIIGQFDFTRLPQTDVLEFIQTQGLHSHHFQCVSLARTISPLLNKMGAIENCKGETQGTCTLIAHNLVLVARHVIEGQSIQDLNVTFGYTKFKGNFYDAGQTRLERIIEESAFCDYAIVLLKEPLGRDLGFVNLCIEDSTLTESALLHYPLGMSLKVSVHALVHTEHQADCVLAYHDTDYFSSGGAYFDSKGRMIAMHLGTELKEETTNLLRYALPLEAIVRHNPFSLLKKFAYGELSQDCSYKALFKVTFLDPAAHNYLMDEEGRESEKILRGLLKNELQKKNHGIILNAKNGTINFSASNLEKIASKYPVKYERFKKKCLGKTGLHELTRQFSVTRVIESDHTIPHNVWNSTINPKMNKIASNGGGKRQGENKMPAITIPYEIHRELLTTGSSKESKVFRQELLDLCNAGRIKRALIKCYQEYEDKGLDLQLYKSQLKNSLDDHVDLGLISNTDKMFIINKFSL